MYTGYYAKVGEYRANGLIPVCISLGVPDWWDGPVYQKLAPTIRVLGHYKLCNRQRTESQKVQDYLDDYAKDVLINLDPKIVLEELSKFGDIDKLVLCCYEKPSDFCHRQIVASWMRVKAKIPCKEFSLEVEPNYACMRPDGTIK